MKRRGGGKRAWRAEDVFRSLKDGEAAQSARQIDAGMRAWAGMFGKRRTREEA